MDSLIRRFLFSGVFMYCLCGFPCESSAFPVVGEFFNDVKNPSRIENKEARVLVNRVIGAAGGFSRWQKKRSVIVTTNVDFYDPNGNETPVSSQVERFIFKKHRHCTYLANSVLTDGREIVYATNGREAWVTIDGIALENNEENEKCLRRLRETWFWLRFPFSLKQKGTVARIGGSSVIHGGRTTVTFLDVLPARRGDMWPGGFIRLIVNDRTALIEGIVYPRATEEQNNVRARLSNLVLVDGISLPHTREFYNEEGIIARETVTARTYNTCIPERYFHKPVFDVW